MFAKNTRTLLIDKLELRNWFISRKHYINPGHAATVGEVLNEQIAVFIDQLGGMAEAW
ncbi:hypothetical protein [Collimonas sp.]|jgi:hypothetical protein|uniref:hypothetical protein n=1 Tax=Collimonas sp. TaxID=1963772 RepID=UPI002B61DAFF|nr:hypothetical protein [Collimonas sp.]HWX02487.1 hypothetical protein [Collimonas sp.]